MTAASVLGIPHLVDERVVGRGGFATVYAATDTRFDRQVAVKVLEPIVDDVARRRFETECRVMGRLSGHPNVVTVHDAGFLDDERPYIVMEFIEGGSVADRLPAHGTLPWTEVREVALAIADALRHAHEAGVLHRDVKPENILFDQRTPKLTDFGISSVRGRATATTASSGLSATLLHTAPETFSNQRDERSDLYSLASTMHALLTGNPPFYRATDESLEPLMMRLVTEPAPALPEAANLGAVSAFLQRALAKDPADRPQSAVEFLAELRALPLDGAATEPQRFSATVPVPPPVLAPPALASASERSWLTRGALVAAMVLGLLLVGGVGVFVAGRGSDTGSERARSSGGAVDPTDAPAGEPTPTDAETSTAPTSAPATDAPVPSGPEPTGAPPDIDFADACPRVAPALEAAPASAEVRPDDDECAVYSGTVANSASPHEFFLDVAEGDRLSVEASGACRLDLVVIDARGDEFSSDNLCGSTLQVVTATGATAGTHILRIVPESDGTNADYNLQVFDVTSSSKQTEPDAREFECNRTPSTLLNAPQAATVRLDVDGCPFIAGELAAPGERHDFEIDLADGDRLSLVATGTCFGSLSTIDPRAVPTDPVDFCGSLVRVVEATAATAGTLVIRLELDADRSGGDYELRLFDVGEPSLQRAVVDLENSCDRATAEVTLAPASAVQRVDSADCPYFDGALVGPGSFDAYSVEVGAGGSVFVVATGSCSASAIVRDPRGTSLDTDDVCGSFDFEIEAAQAGTYTVLIVLDASATTGDYELTLFTDP